MMRWRHYHNVTKLLAAQHIISETVRSQSIWQLRPEMQDVLRHGGRPASQLYWHSVLCHPFIAKLKEQTRPRGVWFQARAAGRRPASGSSHRCLLR